MLGRRCGLSISQEAHVRIFLKHEDLWCEAGGGGEVTEVMACEVGESVNEEVLQSSLL